MTALAQRIKETPMAPYADLLRGMTPEQKQIVVSFITESMEAPKTTGKPYKVMPVSDSIKKWSGCAADYAAHEEGCLIELLFHND